MKILLQITQLPVWTIKFIDFVISLGLEGQLKAYFAISTYSL